MAFEDLLEQKCNIYHLEKILLIWDVTLQKRIMDVLIHWI